MSASRLQIVIFCASLLGGLASTGRATTVIPPDFSELVNESDYIVRARVSSVKSNWITKNGRRNIFTHVELKVLEVISGTPPQPLVLEILGGRVEGEEMVVQGMPQFVIGQEDVLFVRGNGKQFYPLTAAMHGRYPVVREKGGAAHVRRSNDQPLRRTEDVKLPLDEHFSAEKAQYLDESEPGLTVERFIETIRAAIDVNRRPRA